MTSLKTWIDIVVVILRNSSSAVQEPAYFVFHNERFDSIRGTITN